MNKEIETMKDSDDADLEFLRQVALSSLLKKKNIPSNTNALFYNPSAKPNLISIEPVKEDYFEDDNNEFSTEYVIAEGLSVSSSDVDEIIEEVYVSGDDDKVDGGSSSSEGEDAVSVASKDSFDEILNSIEEEVKDAKSGTESRLNRTKRRRPPDTCTNRSEKEKDKEAHPRRNISSNNRKRSGSPPTKKPYPRRPINESRKLSPIRHLHSRRSRSRSPPPLRRRTRSPRDDRRDRPTSSFSENRRRTGTRSPAENRRPQTRSPPEVRMTRSPMGTRRLSVSRSSVDGRKSRPGSPRKRSRTPVNNNRRQRSRSPFLQASRRRRTRSPYRRPVAENNRRYGRRTRSRSPLKTSTLDEKKQTSKSPVGNDEKASVREVESKKEDRKEIVSSETQDNVTTEPSCSRKSQSPENKKLSEALKLNVGRSTKFEKEPYRKRSTEYNQRFNGRRDRRSKSRSRDRSRDRDRRFYDRRSPVDKNKRRKTQSRSPAAKKKPRTRTPSPQSRNLSKEELEVFEKRKRKFQANMNMNKLSGKIKLKSKNDLPDRQGQGKNVSENCGSGNRESTSDKANLSDKKSELSLRLGGIVQEQLQGREEDGNDAIIASSSPDPSTEEPSSSTAQEEDSNKCSVTNSDDGKEDLRTKLQQKRAVGIGRLFSVALQDTLSTSSSSEDSPKKSLRKPNFSCT